VVRRNGQKLLLSDCFVEHRKDLQRLISNKRDFYLARIHCKNNRIGGLEAVVDFKMECAKFTPSLEKQNLVRVYFGLSELLNSFIWVVHMGNKPGCSSCDAVRQIFWSRVLINGR